MIIYGYKFEHCIVSYDVDSPGKCTVIAIFATQQGAEESLDVYETTRPREIFDLMTLDDFELNFCDPINKGKAA